jgi:hypothetical protein
MADRSPKSSCAEAQLSGYACTGHRVEHKRDDGRVVDPFSCYHVIRDAGERGDIESIGSDGSLNDA